MRRGRRSWCSHGLASQAPPDNSPASSVCILQAAASLPLPLQRCLLTSVGACRCTAACVQRVASCRSGAPPWRAGPRTPRCPAAPHQAARCPRTPPAGHTPDVCTLRGPVRPCGVVGWDAARQWLGHMACIHMPVTLQASKGHACTARPKGVRQDRGLQPAGRGGRTDACTQEMWLEQVSESSRGMVTWGMAQCCLYALVHTSSGPQSVALVTGVMRRRVQNLELDHVG